MKKSILGLVACSFLVFQSCQNESDDSSENQDSKVILNTSSQSLSTRMNHDNSGVFALTTGIAARSSADNSSDFPMALLAEINPPSYNGLTLKATHVDVKDNYVYVSYNTHGDDYLGAIDVIDVSEPNNPKLVIQAILPNIDISTVQYDNGNLYIAGAADVDHNSELITPAFVGKMPLQAGLLTDDYNIVSLLSNVGTGLAVADSKYYGVSGSNGVVAKIDKATNKIEATIAVADLRAVGHINNKIVVLSGKDGVKVFDADNLDLQLSFPVSTDVPDAKRTIDFQGNNVLVSEGYQGLRVYNLSSGNLVQTLSLPTDYFGIDAGDVVTNAVSANGDFVYVANGAAGVSVYKKTEESLRLLGSIQLEGSSNYVKSVGDYIYVATGNGGLKIIKKVTVPTIDCGSFPTYNGGQNLNVNTNDDLKYQGSASLKTVNVNDKLTFCGSLAISEGVNINSNGVFYMKGALAQGQYNSNSSNFNVNGTLKIEGSVVIYGDMVLNSGARLEFVGPNSDITIYGKVTKNNGVTITGIYKDTFNKLK